MKLNLGCGDDRLAGYVNIDLRSDVADVVADVRNLPYEDGSVDEIVAHDIIEHLPPQQTTFALREWLRVLRPGGIVEFRLPNLLALANWIVRGFRVEAAIRNVYGGHRWGPDGEWDCHHAGWTPVGFELLLVEHGFEVVGNDQALNMTVTARRPA